MKKRSLARIISNLICLAGHPLVAFCLAFAIYALFALSKGSIFNSSLFNYFNYLADAFLHGQFHLRLLPEVTHDLVYFDGHYYLYWPPFPAVALMPFVAIFGVGFSDIFFTLVIASVNVALVAQLLRLASVRGVIRLNKLQRGLLVLFFAFGTVHITQAPFGRVWALGQLVGFACLALAYLAALRFTGWPAFLLTGLAVAAAAATRNNLVFAGLWPAYYLLRKHWTYSWGVRLRLTLIGILPLAAVVAALFAYNSLRFGSIFDVGLAYHQMSSTFKDDFQRYGAFNLHYLPINFFYQYIAYPLPPDKNTAMGGSLFLLSPVFFGVFASFKTKYLHWSSLVLLVSILLVNIPILLLMGTGWIQFGPRYTLDFTIPLLLLTALGIRHWSTRILTLLIAISVVQYLFGTLLLGIIL